MKTFLDVCRGLTRPTVTLMLVGVLCAIVLRLVWNTKIPSLPAEVWSGLIMSFTTAVALALGFWFGARGRSQQP